MPTFVKGCGESVYVSPFVGGGSLPYRLVWSNVLWVSPDGGTAEVASGATATVVASSADGQSATGTFTNRVTCPVDGGGGGNPIP